MPRTDLADQIDRWSRRARAQQSARLAGIGLAAGLALALTAAIVSRLRPLWSNDAHVLLSITLGLAAAGIAALLPWLRRRDRADWAREFDARFGLDERISTALELESGRIRTQEDAMRRAQRADAEAAANAVDIRRALPLRPHTRALAVAAAITAAAALTLLALPNPSDLRNTANAAFRRTLQQQSLTLQEARDALAANTTLDPAQRDAALRALDQAQQSLAAPDITPDQALTALRDAQSELNAAQDAAAQNAQDALQQAGRALPPDPSTAALADALRSGRLGDAAEQLRALDPRTTSESQLTANQLEQIAQAVQESNPRMAEALRQAAESMRSNEQEQAQQALEQAAQAMERTQQGAQSNEALQQSSENLAAAQQAAAEMQSGTQTSSGENADAQAGEQNGGEAGDAGRPGEGGSEMSGLGPGQTGHSEDAGSADEVYAPSRVRAPGEQVALPAAQSDVTAGSGGRSLPAPDAAAQVPYSQVYGEYAADADEALRSESIPAARRAVVREYFQGIGE